MSADSIRTIDSTAARPSPRHRRHEPHTELAAADDHRELWPTMSDASPPRSAVIGLLREYRIDTDHVDVPALTATRGCQNIADAAERLGVPLALLQLAILQDIGAATVVRVHGDVDIADVLEQMPSFTPNDRELVTAHLRARSAAESDQARDG